MPERPTNEPPRRGLGEVRPVRASQLQREQEKHTPNKDSCDRTEPSLASSSRPAICEPLRNRLLAGAGHERIGWHGDMVQLQREAMTYSMHPVVRHHGVSPYCRSASGR